MQTLRSEPGGVWLSVPVHFKAGSAAQISSIGLFREARAFGFRPALLSAAVRETQEQVAGSFRTLAIAAPLLVLAITWILLGRGSAALLALLPMGAGVLTALAVAGAASIPISTLTLIVTPLLFGLGVDYGIYMVHAWLEAGWRSGSAALGAAGRTVVAASSTTFTGFASLCLAEFRGLREIGVLTACGIAAAVLAAILVLPAALALRARGEERS
jgi:predicted RND superfamily exporter protein